MARPRRRLFGADTVCGRQRPGVAAREHLPQMGVAGWTTAAADADGAAAGGDGDKHDDGQRQVYRAVASFGLPSPRRYATVGAPPPQDRARPRYAKAVPRRLVQPGVRSGAGARSKPVPLTSTARQACSGGPREDFDAGSSPKAQEVPARLTG
jgi:hypothetical protein